MRAWFYPGMNYGQEFVYPKAKAVQIAQETNMPVLSADIPAESTEPIKSASEPAVAAMQQAPVVAVKPTGEEMQLADVVTPLPETKLPTTASPIPMLALFGSLALVAAFALRAFERRSN